MTINEFIPLIYNEDTGEIAHILNKDNSVKAFKTRKACEDYCAKHKYLYVERKSIFYR